MDELLQSKDIEYLQRRLGELVISISKGDDGKFTACSHSEPLFCFIRADIDALEEVVNATLLSYVRNFYTSLGDFTVTAVKIPPPPPSMVPRHRLKPVGIFKPTFSKLGEDDRLRALA